MSGLPTGPFLNAEAIYKGLLAMGLSTNAAAGVAGNIYQESHGNPGIGSSAGGGLFGETIANSGSASGGSLAQQLSALAAYIAKNGSISDINAHASTPKEASDYFEKQYERPNAALANTSAREAAADWVISSAKSGNWGSSGGTAGTPAPTADTSGGSGIGISWPPDLLSFFSTADETVTALIWLTKPSNWIRIVAFLIAIAILLFAVYAFISISEGNSQVFPTMPKVMPVPI
jgi:hypothetical protein